MKKRIQSLDDYINESTLITHTENELKRAGLFDKDSDYNGMLGKAVVELMKTFTKQGHSGFSAKAVIELFTKVASWETLTPITSDPKEWEDVSKVSDMEEGTFFQNKRNSKYFSNDAGKTWWSVDEKYLNILENYLNESKRYKTVTDLSKIQIKELKQLKNYKTSVGFTNVTIKNNILTISHNGNMGNSIEQSVDPNLKKLKFPTVFELKSELKTLSEKGNPDYMWEIKFKLK